MYSRLIGIAYAAVRFHSGQGSRGYRLLSRIGWDPRTDRAAALLPKDEYSEERSWAAHYMRRARKNPRLF